VQAAVHWDALSADILDRVLATKSLVVLALTYPFVKAIHELGHGYVVKRWGGEVHELGLMFLVFVPVPYVEASAATAFRSKWRRALVGAAGILVESFLAALALFVWISVEPGLVRAFAFNVMLIGGVSTLLFNGNPLLRFDGYYVFSDLIEIPNLGQRATRYLGYLAQKYAFGVRECETPATVASERKWLFAYAVASFIYRIFIMSAIVMFVATKFFFIGVVLAAWGLVLMVGMPLYKGLRYLFTNPALKGVRFRAQAVCLVVLALLAVPLLFFPVPYRTVAEGIVMPARGAAIYAGATGKIKDVQVPAISEVKRGQTLAHLEDPLLESRVRVVQAEVKEYRLRYEAALVNDRIGAKIHKERLRRAEKELLQLTERREQLQVTSPRDGVFIMPAAVDMPGRFLAKGSLIGFVIDPKISSILTVVRDVDADLVRNDLRSVEIRRIGDLDRVVPAVVVRELPAISNSLPSLALSTEGGGSFVLDPDRATEGKVIEGLLQIEISPLEDLEIADLGGRVLVRFDHEPQPLANRMYRALRQLLLEKFNV
jgi:putative peptide zinc metalloprotease protein